MPSFCDYIGLTYQHFLVESERFQIDVYVCRYLNPGDRGLFSIFLRVNKGFASSEPEGSHSINDTSFDWVHRHYKK